MRQSATAYCLTLWDILDNKLLIMLQISRLKRENYRISRIIDSPLIFTCFAVKIHLIPSHVILILMKKKIVSEFFSCFYFYFFIFLVVT